MNKIIIANLKAYLDIDQTINLCNGIENNPSLIIAPTSTYLGLLCREFPGMNFAAQDISGLSGSFGAYTGEVTAEAIKALGVNYTVIGHSERRVGKLDDYKTIEKKLNFCYAADITPILCIGETSQDRKANNYKHVINEQLQVLGNEKTIIAYEPVWSIGTGVVPSIEQIEEIKEIVNSIDKNVFFVYGGSVNAENAAALISKAWLDGLLVGKASTDLNQLKSIMRLLC